MKKITELNRKLYRIINHIKVSKKHNEMYALFYLMYKFGLRVNELKRIEKWRDNGEYYVLSTSKYGKKRGLKKSDIDGDVIDEIELCIAGKQSLWRGKSYKQIYNIGMAYMVRYNVMIDGKYKPTHSFRHNNIKVLKMSGFPDKDIKNHFGLINIKTVKVYSESKIA